MRGVSETSVRLTLDEAELPPRRGSAITVTVNDAGHGEFFGEDGPQLGWGYTFAVNGEPWRGILETVTAVDGGSRVTLRIEGRYAVVGAVLTSADPQPAAGTIVRDDLGRTWQHDWDGGAAPWTRTDAEDDPESWTKVAGNYGPVTVIEIPED